MRMVTVSVFKHEHLVLLGVSDPDFFKDCFGVRMDVPDLSDPFNWSGLPYHIKQKVVSDFWATQEDQFVMDWVSEAPEGEIRFGGTLNLHGTEDNYRTFPEFPDYPVSSHRQEMFDEYALRRKMIQGMGLPSHLVSAGERTATLRIPKMNNEVRYNGVVLSQLEIPVELEPTRKLVIEFINEIAVVDHPNLLTLFVDRGGNIHDLTKFFSLVKVAAEKEQILEDSFERGHERDLRDSVRGIFQDNLCPEIHSGNPIIGRGQQLKRPMVDRDHTKLAIKATPEQLEEYAKASGLIKIFENGEFIPQVKAYAVGADGVKRDLRDIDFMSILLGTSEPTPIEGEIIAPPSVELDDTPNRRNYGILIRESLDSEGNVEYHLGEPNEKPLEGQIVDKGVIVQVISDTPGDSSDLWPPIDILMSQKAIDRRMVRKEEHLFPFAGHMYKQTVFLTPEDVTGLCELYIPVKNAELEYLLQTRRPNPLREQWEKHGDPHEGRIPHIARFADIVSSMSQQGRNETMAVYIEPVLTPEEIVDREQAIQEASEGKLDYLLEGTQWDPKNRK